MRAVDIIRAKRDGEALGPAAIGAMVRGVLDGSWADYQTSALLMAIVLNGMTGEETAALTDAMLRSGRRVHLGDLPGVKVGKHSTGGVGDKVSVVLAPLVAACGITMPKMSGRGLGHTGGTLDKLESIPGFRVDLTEPEFLAVLGAVGCAVIGQTADIVPADKVLYGLRDVTATVESVPLISASIMSKKLAEGSDALVLDVKCGRGAFMRTLPEALMLAQSLVSIGRAHGVPTEAVVTGMDVPLGRAIGNAVEIRECVEALSGHGAADLMTVVEAIGTRVLRLGGRASDDAGARRLLHDAIASGAARRRLRDMVAAQGGDPAVIDDPSRLPAASVVTAVLADSDGVLSDLDAARLGQAAVLLGAGREKKGDAVDHAAGIVLRVAIGETVRRGQPLFDLHAADAARIEAGRTLAASAVTIGGPLSTAPLVRAFVGPDGAVREP